MSINIQLPGGQLKEIAGQTMTKNKIIETLGYIPANETHGNNSDIHVSLEDKQSWDNKSNFSGNYNDLNDRPSIDESEPDKLLIVDSNGNILVKFDSDGMDVAAIKINGKNILDLIDERINASKS